MPRRKLKVKEDKHEKVKETKRKEVLGRKKKKPIEDFVNPEEMVLPAPVDEVIGSPLVLCDCGKEAHPGSSQCWACAHRA
jgi:hypothetical protein